MFETIDKADIKQVIYGVCPSKSNCYRIHAKGFLFKTKALTEYEAKFYMQCTLRNKMITGYFEIYLNVFYPSERSDLDNSLKVLIDSLRGLAYVDDKQIVEIHAMRHDDKDNPRVEVVVGLA